MTASAIVLQHVPHEGPGLITEALRARGVAIEERRLFAGDAVPSAIAAEAVLVVMGGPMGVGDLGDPRWPFLAPEVALLRRHLGQDGRVIGVCLGAQLLAHAAGARVYPNPNGREVGWGTVDLVGVGGEPVLAGLAAQETVLHWHGDTFDLPIGATLLASTAKCRHQAYRLGNRQFGLQFHCEVDAATVATWVREDAEYVAGANGPAGGRRILDETPRVIAQHQQVGRRLIGNILDAMAV
jgi:GMP synthase-like glutamine amidotransferase